MSGKPITVKVEKGEKANTRRVVFEVELTSDQEAIDKADLGKRRQTCKICGAEGDFQTWVGVELFIGLKESFNYFVCPECETLQIQEFPSDIGRHYAHDYYSFSPPEIRPAPPGTKKDSRMILDVGCGNGAWLCSLAAAGCVNLFGCDPFIEKNLTYANGVKIKKSTIHEMDGQYDVIHLGDSFEHMPDPHEVFQSFDRLLKHGKGVYGEAPKVEIIIPVYPNIAFDVYGPFWYQMDPPRHFFLYSEKSLKMLADQYGFDIASIDYASAGGAFAMSRMYQMGITFMVGQQKLASDLALKDLRDQTNLFSILAKYSDEAGHSDHATITLVRRK
ncbi:MAG: class I SAM-dependent methyltransferase [Clostridiales bacterium]|jgi:SAM-dependent methyltransferase|nr:class I SAM-dependent methyltransferase [Clostridiales bacterium]